MEPNDVTVQQDIYAPALPQSSFEHSPTIGKLIEALAKASATFKIAKKDTENPAYRGSKYTPLENLIDATRDSLASNGITLIQMPKLLAGQEIEVTTLIAHSSGEWICSRLALPATMRDRYDAQSAGSGITYARRYSLQSMLNIAGEVDDDGNAAVSAGSKEAAQQVAKQKLADYDAKSKDSVKDKVVDIFSATLGTLQIIVFVRSEAMALLIENGLADFTAYNEGLKARYFKDDLPNKEKLAALCGKLNIKIRTINQPGLNKPDQKVIKSAAVLTSKKHQKYLKVMFGNDDVVQELACFVPDLFDEIVANIGNPAEFILDAKGKYIQGITSMNGRTYSTMEDGRTTPDVQREFATSDSDLPSELL